MTLDEFYETLAKSQYRPVNNRDGKLRLHKNGCSLCPLEAVYLDSTGKSADWIHAWSSLVSRENAQTILNASDNWIGEVEHVSACRKSLLSAFRKIRKSRKETTK